MNQNKYNQREFKRSKASIRASEFRQLRCENRLAGLRLERKMREAEAEVRFLEQNLLESGYPTLAIDLFIICSVTAIGLAIAWCLAS